MDTMKYTIETHERLNKKNVSVEVGKQYRTVKRGTLHTVTRFWFNAWHGNGIVETKNDDNHEFQFELDEFIDKFEEA